MIIIPYPSFSINKETSFTPAGKRGFFHHAQSVSFHHRENGYSPVPCPCECHSPWQSVFPSLPRSAEIGWGFQANIAGKSGKNGPHWFVLIIIHIGDPFKNPGSHFTNAKCWILAVYFLFTAGGDKRKEKRFVHRRLSPENEKKSQIIRPIKLF